MGCWGGVAKVWGVRYQDGEALTMTARIFSGGLPRITTSIVFCSFFTTSQKLLKFEFGVSVCTEEGWCRA